MNKLHFVLAFVISTAILTIPTPAQTEGNAAKSPIVTEQHNPRLKSPITLWAKNASLSEVLKVLAEKSGMNFVAGEGVHRDKITIILSKTPLDEAINLLARAAGLSYEIIGNSVLIAESEKLKEEVGQSGYVVELKYAKAGEVAGMLSDLTKNVKVDQGGNRLVAYTSPRVIKEIEKVVMAIDHPHILVLLKTRLIEVSLDKDMHLGVDWGKLSPVTSGAQLEGGPITPTWNPGNWYQLPSNFNLALDMLVAEGDARVLMDSKLTTTNNRQASLHIGEIVPYTIQSYNLSSSGGVNQQIEKEEVGVKLTMTPHVNDDKQITLSLRPEVSTIAGWKGNASDLPLIKIRTAETTVRVENQQTIFLAGLISEDRSIEVRRLPVLGRIPLLGLLFRNHKEVLRRSNLVIEITPQIIHNPSELSFEGGIKELYEEAEKNKTQMK